ncbi:MAG: tetratricopeptide repeat protein [Bacteroidetes bacterium]|jgi:TolA-binding protein|nr:tetratricopeptide repeat protein [Bacteroidota bacterium]
MLQPKKKISRREIKQDQLVTRAMQVEAWALENKKYITYVGVGLVALIAIAFVWSDRSAAAETEAMTRLAKVVPIYDRGSFQQAIDGAPAEGTFGLRSIVDEYGSTSAGMMARVYLANAYVQQGKYTEALEQYEDVSVGDRVVASGALAGAAKCHEHLGSYNDAAASYERAASLDPKNPLAPDRLLAAAANFKRAGKPAEAASAIATLRKQYPNSSYARDLDRFEAEFAS